MSTQAEVRVPRDLGDIVAVVTGASRGVGRGIALALGDAGATVYVTGRSGMMSTTTQGLPGTIQETARDVTERGGKGIGVRCDHTRDGDVASLFRRVESEHGGLDLLVNSVWGGYEIDEGALARPFWEQPLGRAWDGMFTAGVRAHLVAAGAAARLMVPRGQGIIVNVSAGELQGFRGAVAFDTATAAIDRMAFGMAHRLREHGVSVLSLHPVRTRTERAVLGGVDGPGTASAEYTGRVVAALAADPDVARWSGGTLGVAELARVYDVLDVDGTQPDPGEPWQVPAPEPVG